MNSLRGALPQLSAPTRRTRRVAAATCSGTRDALPPIQRARTIAFAALTAASLVLAPCDEAQAARSGGRFGGHRPSLVARRRSSNPIVRHRTPPRYRVPLSLRLHHHSPLLGDMLVYPDLAAGLDLEGLPLWASLLGLLAANAAVLAGVLAVLRNINDDSEPLTVLKVQVALLERKPQLQSRLAELSSMIQVGQQGAWLICEEAVLELLRHQRAIAYASVSRQVLGSKKKAYAAFGAIAEAEAAKANREEAVVRHVGETESEDEFEWGRPAGTRSGGDRRGGGLWGGLMSLGQGPAAKEVTVVTMILAARGQMDVQEQVTDWASLRHTLQQVSGLSSSKIMAVELVWTPRSESDYLTRPQLEADYPELVQLAGHEREVASK